MQAIYSTLIKALHKEAKDQGHGKAVLGLSGGVDSAVALCLAVRAFGPKNTSALILPETGITPNDDVEHARKLAAHFGVNTFYQPINNFLVDFSFLSWKRETVSELAEHNLKSRMRSLLIRHYAETHPALIIGTANKSDFKLGLGTLDGEFSADVHVLGDLYKTDVLRLAEFIGLPDELVQKSPSRHLHLRQTDASDLSGPWSLVDDILMQFESGVDPSQMIEKGMDPLVVHKIIRLIQENASPVLSANRILLADMSESIHKAQAVEASSLN